MFPKKKSVSKLYFFSETSEIHFMEDSTVQRVLITDTRLHPGKAMMWRYAKQERRIAQNTKIL